MTSNFLILTGILAVLHVQILGLGISVTFLMTISYSNKTQCTQCNSSNVVSPGSILDLAPTNNESFGKDVTAHPYAFDSDHHPVSFGLSIKAKRPNNVQGRVYCVRRRRTLPWVSCER